MTDEELRGFARELATSLGDPHATAAITAAFNYVRACTRNAERERCAKACEDRVHAPIITFSDAGYNTACRELASAIRRGDTGQGKEKP